MNASCCITFYIGHNVLAVHVENRPNRQRSSDSAGKKNKNN